MKAESLEEKLKQAARDVIEYRVEQWATYYFEKEFLPGLKREIQERCVITMLTSAQHSGITFDITFTPRPEKQ